MTLPEATQSHISNGKEIVQVERGCATFGVENGVKPGLDCYDTEDKLNNNQKIAVCKDYCLANDCNNQQPTFNDASGGIWPACVTCEVLIQRKKDKLNYHYFRYVLMITMKRLELVMALSAVVVPVFLESMK